MESWRFAVLYSRQETTVESRSARPLFDLKVERYMVGIQEEKGEGPVRWIGTAFIGATRLVPRSQSLGSDLRFAAGLELGVKYFVSKRLGLRAQARGFYTFVEADTDALCVNGTCVFAFSGSGMAQGEVSGGVVAGLLERSTRPVVTPTARAGPGKTFTPAPRPHDRP